MDGQYLSCKASERPQNKIIMEVFDELMDFGNFPDVRKAFKLRLFGLNPCADADAVDILYEWMQIDKVELEQQNKVFEPILAVMRKLLFDHNKNWEKVTVRKKVFNLEWEDDESFEGSMDNILKHLDNKKNDYYEKIKNNKIKKIKAKYGDEIKEKNEAKKVRFAFLFIFFVTQKV